MNVEHNWPHSTRTIWVIAVVDPRVKRWAPVQGLTRLGARASTIEKYVSVRRTMTPAGLRKKLRDQEN